MTALATACFALLGGLTWLLACLLLASAPRRTGRP
jgi:hypothetical protein